MVKVAAILLPNLNVYPYTNTRFQIKITNPLLYLLFTRYQTDSKLTIGCLSPTLFKIFLEQALKLWKRKCKHIGKQINNNTIYTLSFADDQLVVAQDYEDLEYMSRKLIAQYKNWGMDINKEKTKYMCIGGQPQDLILEDGEIIRQCN